MQAPPCLSHRYGAWQYQDRSDRSDCFVPPHHLRIIGITIQKHDDIGILLDGSGSRRSDSIGCLSGRVSTERDSCESAITGHSISLASPFREREISDISCWRLSPLFPLPLISLKVVNDDQIKTMLTFSAYGIWRTPRIFLI